MITLPLTTATIKHLKDALRRWLPNVKSSHRVEAVARGSGFSSYAAMLAATRDIQPKIIAADDAQFDTYLASHKFYVDQNILHRTYAFAAIDRVMDEHPRLASHGFGSGPPCLLEDGKRETRDQMAARFNANRADMHDDFFAEAFLLAAALLSKVPKTKTIRPNTNSYWLKHIAEEYPCSYPNGEALGPRYVHNGALIAAAIHLGFDCRYGLDHTGYMSPNASFNMAKRELENLDSEIRPDGAIAETRRAREWDKRHGFISRHF